MPPSARTSPLTGLPAASKPLGDGSLWTWFAEEDGTTYASTEAALWILEASSPETLAATLARVRVVADGARCPALVARSEHRARIGPPPGPLDFRLVPV